MSKATTTHMLNFQAIPNDRIYEFLKRRWILRKVSCTVNPHIGLEHGDEISVKDMIGAKWEAAPPVPIVSLVQSGLPFDEAFICTKQDGFILLRRAKWSNNRYFLIRDKDYKALKSIYLESDGRITNDGWFKGEGMFEDDWEVWALNEVVKGEEDEE